MLSAIQNMHRERLSYEGEVMTLLAMRMAQHRHLAEAVDAPSLEVSKCRNSWLGWFEWGRSCLEQGDAGPFQPYLPTHPSD